MSSPSVPPESSAVLFDIDGTVIDSTYHHALAWFRAFRTCALTVPVWRLHRTIGMGGDKLVAHVTDEQTEEKYGDELRDAWELEYGELVDEVPALPGAADLVRTLDAAGFRIGFASSGKQRFSQRAVEVLGVGDCIDAMTSSDDADESKPEPDILGVTLDLLDGTQAAVVLGDTPWDVEAARRIGLGCVGVLTGGFSRAELEEAGAVHVVASLTDLLDGDLGRYLRPVIHAPVRNSQVTTQ